MLLIIIAIYSIVNFFIMILSSYLQYHFLYYFLISKCNKPFELVI